jgi:hypothetical protein
VSFGPETRMSVAGFASALGVDPQVVCSTLSSRTISNNKNFFTIADLAQRWSCSRGSVYNYLRDAAASIVDFAPKGKKGKKLVPLEVVERIERQRTKKIN